MPNNLIQELYGQGLVNDAKKAELAEQMKKTGKTEEEILLEQNIVPEDVLFALKSKVLKIPVAKPKPQDVPPSVLELISEEAATNYKMTPLFRKENMVGVGMVYPENILAQNALRFLSRKENFTPEIYLISFTDLKNILKQQKSLKKETKKALVELGKDAVAEGGAEEEIQASVRMGEEAPIIKMVMVILRHAIEGGASDIHIEPIREKLNIRFRQDGILHLSLFLPLSVHLAIVSRIKILANLKIDENRVPQDGRFSSDFSGKAVDFRVATMPTLYGEKVVLRVLDSEEGLKSFDKMGLSGRNLELIQAAVQNPYGLILSSGPTGSGKSTTLYSFLRVLNKEGVNIVTVEDPIEYSIEGVNQSQVRPEIGYNFSDALRQILRQDPNIIMVGEIRDEETANLTIHAALTGHIVLSTIHTNSAAGVVPRLIDMGIRPFLIPSTLKVAISQRLMRKLCENCKKKVRANERVRKFMAENLKSLPAHARDTLKISEPLYVYEANGCEQCGMKGYKGRSGLYEVFAMTPELQDIILKNPVESAILKEAQKQGMLTMAQEGMLRVLSGETSIDEITRVIEES